jgi:hypothetical protein
MKILEPKSPGTLWVTPGLLRESFTFTYLQITFEKIFAQVKQAERKKDT